MDDFLLHIIKRGRDGRLEGACVDAKKDAKDFIFFVDSPPTPHCYICFFFFVPIYHGLISSHIKFL